MARYVLVDNKGQRLSEFRSNDLVTKHQLKFRKNDWITFSKRNEAERHLKYIKRETRQPKEAERLRLRKVM